MSYVIDIITKSSKQQPDESRVVAVPRYWSVSTIDAPITNDGVTVNLTAVLPVRITFYSRAAANATVSASIRVWFRMERRERSEDPTGLGCHVN